LKQAGLAASQRGKDGGYRLARRRESIAVGEIIRLFEESPSPGADTASYPNESITAVLFRNLCSEADEARNGVFDGVTFQDLVLRERSMEEDYVANYTI
jgi:Rrf2 family protein